MRKIHILEWLDDLDHLCCLEEDKTMDGQRRFWSEYEACSKLQGMLCLHYKTHELLGKTRNIRKLLALLKLYGLNVLRAYKHFKGNGDIFTDKIMAFELTDILKKGYDNVDQNRYVVFGNAFAVYNPERNRVVFHKNRALAFSVKTHGITREVASYFGVGSITLDRIDAVTAAKKVEPDICLQSEATLDNYIDQKFWYQSEKLRLENYREIYSGGFVFLYSTEWRNEWSLVSFIKEETLNYVSKFEVVK